MNGSNAENREKKLNFDQNGKFAKGNTISKGTRNRTQTDKLIAALKKAGNKKGEKFWDVVATTAFKNKDIMKAVLNKLVPTISELTGLDGSPLTFIVEKTYEKPKKEETGEAESG